MIRFVIETDMGFRLWLADDASHAVEQHYDAFGYADPDEAILHIYAEVST